jgi:hypothetical protein
MNLSISRSQGVGGMFLQVGDILCLFTIQNYICEESYGC